ncbi:MAG: endonuclease/exonuclease/phosphatase family protein [Planctomycetaceae bacterium]|nr:endonuclease/exonuclease/phosphatase family protein [Planctomycetaceae bacterium]
MSASPMTTNLEPTPPDSEPSPKAGQPSGVTRLAGRVVSVASVLDLVVVLVLLILLCVVSEDWWLSLAMTYLPRVLFVLPPLFLFVAALIVRRQWIWVNLFSLLLVVVPIMGLRIPLPSILGSSSTGELLTVVSCNIQGGRGNLLKTLSELKDIDPDVVVLQEANDGISMLLPFFEDWSRVHTGEYFVASRYPVKLRDSCRSDAFGRITAILCEVDSPDGPFLICNVHLSTARFGLSRLRLDSILSGVGLEQLDVRQDLREMESVDTRAFASQDGFETPLLVMGDFNTPTSSSLFQLHWHDLSSAFDVAGFGYGYTSPCSDPAHWPSNTPWLRIDHILSSRHWTTESCWIGSLDGSDHRLIAATVRMEPVE